MSDLIPTSKELLLHACCGPCSMEPVRLLRERGVEPVVFYANSNIHPTEEYARRLETLSFWAKDEQLQVIEGAYEPELWEKTVGRIGDAAQAKFGVVIHEASHEPLADSTTTPEESESAGIDGAHGSIQDVGGNDRPSADKDTAGEETAYDKPADAAPVTSEAELARQARCRACYRLRFEETAQYAVDHGFSAIGTTLSVSPYQYTAIIREELERAAQRAGLEAHFEDYRPYYDNATERSREAGMYRQNYCACRFSAEESQLEREERKRARKAAKAAKAAAQAEEREAIEAEREAKRAKRSAYDAKQARKRAILKQLRDQA